MSELFQNVLHGSFSGGVVVLAVLLLRLALKKAPKKYLCLLWILVGLRLLCPVEIESPFSLQPDVEPILNVGMELPPQTMEQPMPEVPEDAAMPEDVTIEYGDAFLSEEAAQEKTVVIDYWAVAGWVWLSVACLLGLYSAASYLRLKGQVRSSVIVSEGLWECPGIDTAFILGYLRPQIYLPAGLSAQNRQFILDHERVHLKRGDHWVKLAGFVALAVHWFNPLVWAAYVLMCRDIEMACDESVVKDMDLGERKSYSAALVACSAEHRFLAACPVAFGEVSVKQRILGVLNYRKPRFWLTILAVAAIVFVAVCFLTDPAAKEPDLSFLNYQNAVSLAAEQDVLAAVHYTADDEQGNIGIGMVEGEILARYLDSADWREKWFEPTDLSSPGSVAFNIAGDYRITVYDRRFAAVEFDGEVRYYRIGRNDYAAAVDMVLPAEQERLQRDFDIYLGTATLDAPDWGIALETESVTPGGLALFISQEKDLVHQELFYGQGYSLERWNGNTWEAVEPIIDNGAFTMEAILLPQNQTTRLDINWEWLYGQLPAGTYRIGKSIHNDVTAPIGVNISLDDLPEELNYTYYAEFTIPGVRSASESEVLDYCKAALEDFQSLESYAVICSNEFHIYDVLNNYSMQRFWVDGGNWYKITDVQEAQTTDYTLYRDGNLFTRVENGHYPEEASVWEEVPADNAEAYLPWLRSYVWNEDKISVDSSQTVDGAVRISLKVEEPITVAGLTVPYHYLVFEFGHRDVLSSVSLSLISDVEDTIRNPARESVYMTVQLTSTERKEIADLIDDTWQQIQNQS